MAKSDLHKGQIGAGSMAKLVLYKCQIRAGIMAKSYIKVR